jgi:hypothetical protein
MNRKQPTKGEGPSVTEYTVLGNIKCVARIQATSASINPITHLTSRDLASTYIVAGLVGSRSFITNPVSAMYAVRWSGEKQIPLGIENPSATIDTRPIG